MLAERYSIQPTGILWPVAEMEHGQFFRPGQLWPWRPARGICRRLGTRLDGRVECEFYDRLGGTPDSIFTLPAGTTRELMIVSEAAVSTS